MDFLTAPRLRRPLGGTGAIVLLLTACANPGTERAGAPNTSEVAAESTPTRTAIPAIATTTPSLPAGFEAIIDVADGPITLANTEDSVWVEAHRDDFISR